MAGALVEDYGTDSRSSSLEEISSDQRCHSGESLMEWRSSEQVGNGTPSTSPAYSDTDDDDSGPRPSELYGRFTWKIDNFSQLNKRELRSNSFDVGGYKWYILIYPQGCDVCNHLSLFLCVANHDKLLPGWSHFAQFTIAVINRDPKKSKYSDTLHRFWKKEHDWGWKKFMELSKLHDGFVVEDVLIIKAQVQVIREKADRPFRCLDGQYRRELVRVYISNVEQICRRFIDERRGKLSRLIDDKQRLSSFNAFWLGMDASVRRRMSREKSDMILKIIVKHFFIEKEVTSTIVMDALYSGLKALECQSKSKKGISKVTEMEPQSTPLILVDQDLFVLADDVIILLERAASETLPHQPLPNKDEKCSQNRTKDGSSGEDIKDSIERDDRRLTELGQKTMEFFALAHIFSRIEVAYQEAVALKRQEELIREEEAGLLEIDLKGKRGAAEKEKRAKKKQTKQKRNAKKSKDKGKSEKFDVNLKEAAKERSPADDRNLDDSASQAELMISKVDNHEDVSDVSENEDDSSEMIQLDLDEREASPVNWETEASGSHPIVGGNCGELQNEQAGKMSPFVDDSSSTCSSDSVPSVVLNGSSMGSNWTTVKSQSSPNRGNGQRKETNVRTGLSHSRYNSAPDSTVESGNLFSCSSKDPRPDVEDVRADPSQKKPNGNLVGVTSPSKLRTTELPSSSSSPIKRPPNAWQQPRCSSDSTSNSSNRDYSGIRIISGTTMTTGNVPNTLDSVRSRVTLPSSAAQTEKSVSLGSRILEMPTTSKAEAQKHASPLKNASTIQLTAVSRPLSAPLVPAVARPTAMPVVSIAQAAPILSRSVSATGRLGNEPSASAPSFVPRSYRSAIMEKKAVSARPSSSSNHQSLDQQDVGPSPSQSSFPSSSFALAPHMPPRKDQISVKPGFTFGTVKPESLNQYPWRESSSQQEASSSTSSSGMRSSTGIGTDIEKLDLYGRLRAKQLLSDIPAFTPYQPQSMVGDEFPHLDIINDLLDEEQSHARTSVDLNRHHSFNRQFSMPSNIGNSSNFESFSYPHVFDQTEQYYDDGFPRVYDSLSGGPRGMGDRNYSHFDLPSYSNGHVDEMMQSHWPYNRTGLSMLNVGTDTNGYYQALPTDFSNLMNGVGKYPMYRPANGH